MSLASRFGLLLLGLLTTCSLVNAPSEVLPLGSGGSGGSGASGGSGGGEPCSMGLMRCDGECVDVLTDPAHCGMCGKDCGLGAACAAGECSCPPGATKCSGVCVDVVTDPDNCKACGTVCPAAANAERTCSVTGCGFACAGGFDDCNGLPLDGCEIDLTSDAAHCSDCNSPCPELPDGTVGCLGSTCVVTSCALNLGDCDGDLGNGCETDLLTTQDHCGSCPIACDAPSICQGGACLDTSTSCLALLINNPGVASGVYVLDADGGGPLPPFSAYCDMTTDGGGWTLIVLTNGNVEGHPNVGFAEAKDTPANVNGAISADLDSYDFFMGTNYWNLMAPNAQMLWKVGGAQAAILDIVIANFNVYQSGERINWSGYAALLGGIANINYQNDGYLQTMNGAAAGNTFNCVVKTEPSVGLHGPWFYTTCSNASPWCTGHGDCDGLPIRMQWRNQDMYTTGTSAPCSNHGEILVR